MLESEKFALAARLHVCLRRKVGRVTDVEWMVRNNEYAREIVRFAREQGDVELGELAQKLEAAFLPGVASGEKLGAAASAGKDGKDSKVGAAAYAPNAVMSDLRDLAAAALSAVQAPGEPPPTRYVGSLR